MALLNNLLNNLVDALASRAGWKRPRQDENGAYCFRLENGLDFLLFSPDERVCILRAELADVPASGPDREEMLRQGARPESAGLALLLPHWKSRGRAC